LYQEIFRPNAFLLLPYPEGIDLKVAISSLSPGKRFLLLGVEGIAALYIANNGSI